MRCKYKIQQRREDDWRTVAYWTFPVKYLSRIVGMFGPNYRVKRYEGPSIFTLHLYVDAATGNEWEPLEGYEGPLPEQSAYDALMDAFQEFEAK